MPQPSERAELQLKGALELSPSGFPYFKLSRSKLVLAISPISLFSQWRQVCSSSEASNLLH